MAKDRWNYYRMLACECMMDAAHTADPLAREAFYERANLYHRLGGELESKFSLRPAA